MRVDGEVRDLSAPLPDGERVEIVTDRSPEALDLIRHDAAHVMATAVMELYPGTKISIGPPIENGFYYDFEFPEGVKVSDEDLARIEERMREHIAADEPFERTDVSADEAEQRFAAEGQDYKVELIRDLVADDGVQTVSLYRNGPFTDLCRGPARALDRAHQGVQAAVARGRLLARRRAQQDADPDLRHRVLLQEGPRAPPRDARAGARARPPPARARSSGLFMLRQESPGHAVLPAERDGRRQRDPAGRARAARPRAATQEIRTPHMLDVELWKRSGPLGQLPREHVLHAGRASDGASTRSSR